MEQPKGYSITTKRRDAPKNFPDVSKWEVRLRGPHGTLQTQFLMGPNLTGAPTFHEVTECIISDALGWENAQDFDDWADNYGYDLEGWRERRWARAVYARCGRMSERLHRFFGEDFDRLVYGEE